MIRRNSQMPRSTETVRDMSPDPTPAEAGPGLDASHGAEGIEFGDPRRGSLWVKITGQDTGTSRYAWEQIDEGDTDAFDTGLAEGFKLSGGYATTDAPAYEINGNTGVAVGTRVRIWPAADLSYYVFDCFAPVVTADYAQFLPAGGVTITANDTWTDAGVCQLPGAGTYLIAVRVFARAVVSALGGAIAAVKARLSRSTDGISYTGISGSDGDEMTVTCAQVTGVTAEGSVTLVFEIEVTGQEYIRLQGWRNSGPTWTSATLHGVNSGLGNSLHMAYFLISGGPQGATGPQGPAGASGGAQLDVANTWTAEQTFEAQAPTETPVTIVGATSQSVPLIELRDSANVLVLGIGKGSAAFTGTSPFTFAGDVGVWDAGSDHFLLFSGGTNLTANRTLTFTTGDADRTLDLSAASVTVSAFGATLVDDASASAARTTLGLVIGTDVQAADGDLSALAALSGTNTIYYRSAASTWTAVVIGTGLDFTGGTLSNTVTSSLPSQATHAGELLTTDGSSASWARTLTNDAASTSTVLTVLELDRTTSGTAAAGLGGRLRFALEDNGGTLQPAGDLTVQWSSAASGATYGRMILAPMAVGVTRPIVDAEASATGDKLGFFGTAPVAKPSSGADVASALDGMGLMIAPVYNIPYVCLRDEKSSGTAGGTFNADGTFKTRTLNTESSDSAGICSLSSSQFTLSAGTYIIRAIAPAYDCDRHQAKLYNVTDATDVILGTSEFAGTAGEAQTSSTVSGKFTIAASKALELRHRCNTTSTTLGFGVPGSFGTEVYAVVELWKVG